MSCAVALANHLKQPNLAVNLKKFLGNDFWLNDEAQSEITAIICVCAPEACQILEDPPLWAEVAQIVEFNARRESAPDTDETGLGDKGTLALTAILMSRGLGEGSAGKVAAGCLAVIVLLSVSLSVLCCREIQV